MSREPGSIQTALPDVAHNHARETLDQWWDYAKVMTWERSLSIESFTRSGGGLLQQRLAALEAEPSASNPPSYS